MRYFIYKTQEFNEAYRLGEESSLVCDILHSSWFLALMRTNLRLLKVIITYFIYCVGNQKASLDVYCCDYLFHFDRAFKTYTIRMFCLNIERVDALGLFVLSVYKDHSVGFSIIYLSYILQNLTA